MNRLMRASSLVLLLAGAMLFVVSSAPLNALAREHQHVVGPLQTMRLVLPAYPPTMGQAQDSSGGVDVLVRRDGAGLQVQQVVIVQGATDGPGLPSSGARQSLGLTQTVGVSIQVVERSRFQVGIEEDRGRVMLRVGATSNAQRRTLEARIVNDSTDSAPWELAGLIQGPTGNAVDGREAMQWTMDLGELPADGTPRLVQFRVR